MSALSRCTGDNASSFNDWTAVWANDYCYNTFDDIIYTTPDGKRQFNPQGLISAQNNWNVIFNNYIRWGNNIGSPGDPGYNAFQQTLQNTCARLPGACDIALQTKICANLTREQIANNLGILQLCGCFAAPESGNPCASLTSNSARLQCAASTSGFQTCIPQCDTLCTQGGVVRLSNGIGGTCICQTDVCVINDVSITATNTSTGGNSFSQVCGACGDNGCTCIISGISISTLGSSVGLTSANFNQQCNSNSRCYVSSTAGSLSDSNQVGCTGALDNKIQTASSDSNGTNGSNIGAAFGLPLGFWIAIIVILVITGMLVIYTQMAK